MKTKTVQISILVLSAILLLGHIGLLGVSLISFDWIKPKIDLLANDGDAEKFTYTVFTTIALRLKFAAIFSLLLSGILFFMRHRLSQKISQIIPLFWNDLRQLARDFGLQVQSLLKYENRTHVYFLIIFMLVGVGLRSFFLFQPMRHDEAFTFTNYASKPIWIALSNYSFPNNHLFHTLCVHIVYLIFGNQQWALRLPAFIASVAVLPAVYFLAKSLYNKHAALITTALLVISSALIEYSTNARGYALIICFFIFALLLANYLRHTHNRVAWLFMSCLSAIGFYTVPVMLYPFATLWLWILLSSWQNDFSLPFKRTFWHLISYGIFTIILVSLLYLPVIVASGIEAIIQNRFVQPLELTAFIHRLPSRLADVWAQWSRDYHPLLWGILIVATGWAIVSHHKMAKHGICLALPTVLSLAILLPVQGVLPPERVWLFALPILFIVSSAGLVGFLKHLLSEKIYPKAALTLGITLTIWSSAGAYQALTVYYPYGPGTLKDAEQITQFLKPDLTNGDRFLTVATAAPLEYYFQKHSVPIEYLRAEIRNSNRLIVLVLENKYTLTQVLETGKVPQQNFTSPKLLQAFPSARLYEMRRRATAQSNQNMDNQHDNRSR